MNLEDTGITINENVLDPNIVAVVEKEFLRVKPIMEAHGGGAEIVKATNQEVVISLKGHCAGCPLSTITFNKILDKYIREALPNLKRIEYINQ